MAGMNGSFVHPGAGLVDLVMLDVDISIISALGNVLLSTLGAAGGNADPIPFADVFGWIAHHDPIGQIADFHFYLGTANDTFKFTGTERFRVVTDQ